MVQEKGQYDSTIAGLRDALRQRDSDLLSMTQRLADCKEQLEKAQRHSTMVEQVRCRSRHVVSHQRPP
jgi:hypothetical protein